MHGQTLLMDAKHALSFEICKAQQGQLSHAFFLQLSYGFGEKNERTLRSVSAQILQLKLKASVSWSRVLTVLITSLQRRPWATEPEIAI